jgi:hypothetical protein
VCFRDELVVEDGRVSWRCDFRGRNETRTIPEPKIARPSFPDMMLILSVYEDEVREVRMESTSSCHLVAYYMLVTVHVNGVAAKVWR